jgi:hypothetical protein
MKLEKYEDELNNAEESLRESLFGVKDKIDIQ